MTEEGGTHPGSGPIRVMIVDDEPIARQTLRDLLSREPDVVIVGECGTGSDALRLLLVEEADLIFLDIEMPGIFGIDVVERLPKGVDPLVVFVTAHSEHAVRAFELSALDYVLKPFDDLRIRNTLVRVRQRLGQDRISRLEHSLSALADTVRRMEADSGAPPPSRGRRSPEPHGAVGRLAVHSSRGVDLVATEEIDWIEAEDAYVRLHVQDGRYHLMRDTMTRLEAALDPEAFVRVHRSAIVRIDRVRRFVPLERGDAKVILITGAEVRVSRSRSAAVRASLGLSGSSN